MMNPRDQLISLTEKLRHFPNKNRLHLIQGALEILKILVKNPDGNTFLRWPEEKKHIEVLIFYLKPFAKNLNIQAKTQVVSYHNRNEEDVSTEFACVNNVTFATVKQMYALLEFEQLVNIITQRVNNSYQRIIIGLQLENQRLSQLLKESATAVVEEKKPAPHPAVTESEKIHPPKRPVR